eukprot:c52478_g1_i1.p1 GENE.c52478_g1_i1~~c52478_g1_i1.p1  ORF type:complete len:704 (+),score=98.08 c52478_g1_i1:3-2114(+)
MGNAAAFQIFVMRGVGVLLVFLVMEPNLVSVAQANRLRGSPASAPLSIERCVRNSPHMVKALPALTNKLAEKYEQFGEFMNLLQSNPEAQAQMLNSPEVRALMASGLFDRACEAIAPALRDAHENMTASLLGNTTSRLDSMLGELGQQTLVEISSQINVDGIADTLNRMFGGPAGFRDVRAETPWGTVSTSSDTRLSSTLRSYTSVVGADLSDMSDPVYESSRAFFRAFWSKMVKTRTRQTSEGCTVGRCDYNLNVDGELSDTLVGSTQGLLAELLKLDGSAGTFGNGKTDSCFATFGAVSCCRQHVLTSQCGACGACIADYVPEDDCSEVRELLSDCLMTQFSECSSTLGITQTTYHDLLVCEDSDPTVTCPEGTTIDFFAFNYGRTDPNLMTNCHSKMSYWTSTCVSPNSLSIIKGKCDGQQTCKVDDSWFGDPCPGYSKYLQGRYSCVKNYPSLASLISAVTEHSTPDSPAFFTPQSTSCLCKTCGWERVRELCGGEAKDCQLCKHFATTFWNSRLCPNSPKLESWSPLLNVKVWGGLALFLVALLSYVVQEGNHANPNNLTRKQFSLIFKPENLLTPDSLAHRADMEDHYARALIRKATGQLRDDILADDLFNFLDTDKSGVLDGDEIQRQLFRNYPSAIATIKTQNLIKKGHGILITPEDATPEVPLTRAAISSESVPYMQQVQSRRAPSHRHLNELP